MLSPLERQQGNAWFIKQTLAPPRARLFCFPYPTSSAAAFREWRSLLDPVIDLVVIELPGRGLRFREPPITNIETFLQSITTAMLPLLDLPFHFFGHSNGALLACKVALHFEKQAHPHPERLFLAAPPALPPLSSKFAQASLGSMVEQLRHFNGTSEEELADNELMSLFLPIFQADFALAESCPELGETLKAQATFMAGTLDAVSPLRQIEQWQLRVCGSSDLLMFPGSHFFINSAREAVVTAISQQILTSSLRNYLHDSV